MIEKSFAKVNIFLKITGTTEFQGSTYHTFNSRFMVVKSLYDTIEFVPAKVDSFTIEGLDIPREKNIIYKAYKALNLYTGDLDILEFFYNHKVIVKKNIPMEAGLGGGSSNAATFMKMVQKVCNLKISVDELANIGAKIGADIPFFIYGYDSANVTNIGDVIEPFNEEALDLDIFTPSEIKCNTAKVYNIFKKRFLKEVKPNSGASLMLNSSKDILSHYKRAEELNDLYRPALISCPKLKEYEGDRKFFSGSGSSFFIPKM